MPACACLLSSSIPPFQPDMESVSEVKEPLLLIPSFGQALLVVPLPCNEAIIELLQCSFFNWLANAWSLLLLHMYWLKFIGYNLGSCCTWNAGEFLVLNPIDCMSCLLQLSSTGMVPHVSPLPNHSIHLSYINAERTNLFIGTKDPHTQIRWNLKIAHLVWSLEGCTVGNWKECLLLDFGEGLVWISTGFLERGLLLWACRSQYFWSGATSLEHLHFFPSVLLHLHGSGSDPLENFKSTTHT